jgi:hypothetical protein
MEVRKNAHTPAQLIDLRGQRRELKQIVSGAYPVDLRVAITEAFSGGRVLCSAVLR